MGSMKQEYMQKVKQEMALARKYGEGYEDGCADGYTQAVEDICRVKRLAVEAVLKELEK